MSKLEMQNISDQYEQLFLVYEKACAYLMSEISNIIESNHFKLAVDLSCRVKSKWSLSEKLQSNRANVERSITEINDIAGVRIVVLFKKDVEQLQKIIENRFSILKYKVANSDTKENEFGYSSLHQILNIPIKELSLNYDPGIQNVKVELQIRTLPQHCWAEASHQLQYKRENASPLELKRSLSRISALLEIVDSEYERMLEIRAKIRKDIANDLAQEADINLTVDSLEILLDSLLPHENKIDFEEYSELLTTLVDFDISTRDQVKQLFSDHLNSALQADKIIAKSYYELYERGLRKINKYEVDRAQNGVYFTHSGLVRVMLESNDPNKYKKVFRNVVKKSANK